MVNVHRKMSTTELLRNFTRTHADGVRNCGTLRHIAETLQHVLLSALISTGRDTARHCTRCTTLQDTVPLCKTLQDAARRTDNRTHANGMRTATHGNTSPDSGRHCITLHYTALHCKTLHYTATHCKTLQHVLIPARMPTGCATATHCKILKDTVTHTATSTHAHGVCNGAAILHINYIR